ncbi:helix-turn-helix domain-containing protein [Blastomonas sp.]|uniref:AraC family transcriptional regulator n=1 Tax=Blastomonas sp. TaxID=1909299 RepID=UPI003594668D
MIATARLFNAPTPIGLLFSLGSGATPGLFWLFAKAWFNDEQRVSGVSILIVSLSLLNTLAVQLTYPWNSTPHLVASALFRVFMLGFAAAALREVWRSREGDLIERRRRIRPLLVGVIAIFVILIAIIEITASTDRLGDLLRRLVAGGALLAVLCFCAVMLRMRQADLFGASPGAIAATKPLAERIDDPLSDKLLRFMADQMPHRDETLSIAKLAALLGEQEYRLRRTINGQLGYRNFAAFLNGYRLAEVKVALADPAQKDVPIITIALDAGFGSLGPFNRAFREAEGMTPSEFRARASG